MAPLDLHLIACFAIISQLGIIVVADNGVDGISDVCLDCLGRVQLHKDQLCIEHPTLPTQMLCGEYRISNGFYLDCAEKLPEHCKPFNNTYSNIECGKACVRAYHKRYTETCNVAMGKDRDHDLTCAEHGQIHGVGAINCGKMGKTITEFLQNMTLLCGCQTLYDDRDECLKQLTYQSMTTTARKQTGLSSETAYAIIAGVVCGCVVIIIIVVIVAVYLNRKNSRSVDTSSKKNGVEDAQIFHYHKPSNERNNTNTSPGILPPGDPNTDKQKNSTRPDYYKLDVTPQSQLYNNRPPSIEQLNTLSSSSTLELPANRPAPAPEPISLNQEVPVSQATDQSGELELGYVNMAAISGKRSISVESDTPSRMRAPIPVPRD